MDQWSPEKSEKLYNINEWSGGYFHVNVKGNIQVCPSKSKSGVDLRELTDELLERGIRPPILIRFPDIVKSRIKLLEQCFKNSIKENNYQANYLGVYPIKVNQNRDLVKHIVEYGKDSNLGLEAGSKPELLVVLALNDNPDSLIVCNGFKDEEFIETALLAQKLGKNVLIVVDRSSELPMILSVSKRLNIKPRIGFRCKLYTKGSGKWIESSGARSKFGLTPNEICKSIALLKSEDQLDTLEMVHFHIGSQVKHIQKIKDSLKEGAKYFAEIYRMGASSLKYLDVGGGLGVDYDGTGTTDSSTNYSEQEYANDVIHIVSQCCQRHEVPHPNIITEAGRSLVAHHSVLIFNVLGRNRVRRDKVEIETTKNDSPVIENLQEIYENLSLKTLNESFNDVLALREDALKLYTLGYLSLDERSKAEQLIWANLTKIYKLTKLDEEFEEVYLQLENMLSDTYFCNFSIFQSVPDSWAVKHNFPVVPIQKLHQKPNNRAVIADLTCDSDGKMDIFVEDYETKKSLAVHDLQAGESYYLGTFLVGAYQEALGDLHNLFGDTDSVDVTINNSGYIVEHVMEGDTVSEILSYVHYDRRDLVNQIRKATEKSILQGRLKNAEAKMLLKNYEEGLSGYTYLEEEL